jgi:hypothetical protein
MLAATAKSKRLLEATQLVLTTLSVCAVVEASRPERAADARPGYYAWVQLDAQRLQDRRIADLARSERKRRESEQIASRRGLALAESHRLESKPHG